MPASPKLSVPMSGVDTLEARVKTSLGVRLSVGHPQVK